MSIESQLREALAARADEVAVGADDPYERVAGAIAASRRRRRGVAAGAVAVVAAVAVAVPLLGQGQDRTAPPARDNQTVAAVPTDPALWKSMRTWPTRGGLARDTAFVEAASKAVAPEGNALYAEDLTRNRVVVFWVPTADPGMPAGMLRVASGPRGASADQLATQHEAPAASADAVVFREGADGGGRLVLLTRPSEREAQLSDGVEISPDGTVSRTWQPLRLTGGLGTAQPRAPLSLNRVQVAGYDGPVTLAAGTVPTGQPLPEGAGICMDCAGEVFRQRAEQGVSESVAQRLGLAADQVATTTRYSGPVDAAAAGASGVTDATAAGASHTLYVGDTTVPGGGILRSVILVSSFAGGSGSATELASAVPIDASTAANRPVVVGGLRAPGSGAVLEIFAPGAGSVALVSSAPSLWPDAGAVLSAGRARVDLADAEFRQHYSVEPFDASGRSQGTFPIELPNAGDPFDVQPGG
ncbi:hypothetical protein P0Y31_04835 [Knoellia sp. 3-2P3]|uniref:hypothetical protein n=1 Tax=unclassified Knoellia TaxID=2618719 RepID=UPI0023DA177D|nr:hypothetical protein [Knoellia sp. 3-2P3]MDF2091659.1 hypothetical protein [Knoellia sp. 3-2P3]